MSDILQDLSNNSLVTAIEENLFSWIPLLGRIWEARENDPPGVKRSLCDIPVSLFNSIMDTRLSPEKVDGTIEYIIDDAKLRNVPALWWVGPSTRPANLAGYLQKYGFSVDEDGRGMAVILENLKENLPVPEGFSIQNAQDDEAKWEWCQTMAKGFGITEARVEFAVNSWHHLICRVDPETTKAYTGYLGDKPVATSMLQLGGCVDFCSYDHPEARKGVAPSDASLLRHGI
jgi:hypothetical protein